jgi:hypothetical protein
VTCQRSVTAIFRIEEKAKQETGMKRTANLLADFLLRFLFHSEDGGYLFFETSIDSPDYGRCPPEDRTI